MVNFWINLIIILQLCNSIGMTFANYMTIKTCIIKVKFINSRKVCIMLGKNTLRLVYMKASYKNVKGTLSLLSRVMIGFMYILQYYTSVFGIFLLHFVTFTPKINSKGSTPPFGINFGVKVNFLGVL
jgi:hypothetical protein